MKVLAVSGIDNIGINLVCTNCPQCVPLRKNWQKNVLMVNFSRLADSIMHFLMLTRFVSFFLKFRDALNDCQLPDSEDVYLIRWLIGICIYTASQ